LEDTIPERKVNWKLWRTLKQKEITQEQFAKQLKLDPALLSRHINGYLILDQTTKERAANLLDITVKELFQ
jgi:transcriptional regulator with XRE-family HTH domain